MSDEGFRKLRLKNEVLRSRLWAEMDRLETAILRHVVLDTAITKVLDGEEYYLLEEMHPSDQALVGRVMSLVSRTSEMEVDDAV